MPVEQKQLKEYHDTYTYSAIAVIKTQVFSLPKDEFRSLPTELLNYFKKNIIERGLWME